MKPGHVFHAACPSDYQVGCLCVCVRVKFVSHLRMKFSSEKDFFV